MCDSGSPGLKSYTLNKTVKRETNLAAVPTISRVASNFFPGNLKGDLVKLFSLMYCWLSKISLIDPEKYYFLCSSVTKDDTIFRLHARSSELL